MKALSENIDRPNQRDFKSIDNKQKRSTKSLLLLMQRKLWARRKVVCHRICDGVTC